MSAEIGVKDTLPVILSRLWWLVLLRGLLILVMGILLITRPVPVLLVLVTFLGFYWFFDGLLTIFAALQGRKSRQQWGRGLIAGIISALAGVIIFSQPLVSALFGVTFFIYLIGMMILVSGIWSITAGIALRKQITSEWSMILGGLLSLVLAFLIMMNPVFSALTIVWLIGTLALIGGLFQIITSFRLRKQIKSGSIL